MLNNYYRTIFYEENAYLSSKKYEMEKFIDKKGCKYY